MRTLLGLAACVLVASAALAADLPVRGEALRLRASARNAARRGGVVRLQDAAIAAPFGDPRVDGATLIVHGGSSADQCFVRADLPAVRWAPIGGNGVRRGWRYRDRTGATSGVRRVRVRPGGVSVVAQGAAWPCGLKQPERVPVSVVLGLAGERWCAAFGGTVAANGRGRFRARAAPAPASCPDGDLTVADLNVLHGLTCPAGTDNCRFPERAALLFQWVAAAGCPDVVTLQEVRETQVTTLVGTLPSLCGGAYQAVYDPLDRVDDAMLLTRIPVLDFEIVPLAGNFRNVLHARLDHPLGPVDVFTTHLGASGDGAQVPCTATNCPAECVAAGATTRRGCQGVQVARLVEARHDLATPAVIAGDFNEDPTSFVHAQFTTRGWADSYLAAGNPECDPATGVGCTSGRVDDALTQLESPASNEVERIDFIFVTPAAGCRIEPAGDPDGDGTATALFADRPNPFAPACGPAPAPICWPSDHVGAQLDLDCR
jgi:endonuclease/exonuclease/phosphatase family metal-dependent hydrolase